MQNMPLWCQGVVRQLLRCLKRITVLGSCYERSLGGYLLAQVKRANPVWLRILFNASLLDFDQSLLKRNGVRQVINGVLSQQWLSDIYFRQKKHEFQCVTHSHFQPSHTPTCSTSTTSLKGLSLNTHCVCVCVCAVIIRCWLTSKPLWIVNNAFRWNQVWLAV